MDTKITKEWGYRVLTPTSLNFYHILLPQIGTRFISDRIHNFKEIEFKEDKSIVIHVDTPMDLQITMKELEEMLVSLETQFAQTDKFTYRTYPIHKNFLRNWFLAIEGAVALIVISQCEALNLKPYDFELIDSEVGGIYLHPFTILFYENYAKVIHPIKVNNFFLREQIERVVSTSMRGILQRASEARPGFEGLAIASYVQDKTKLSPDIIAKIINEKAHPVKVPRHSPLF